MTDESATAAAAAASAPREQPAAPERPPSEQHTLPERHLRARVPRGIARAAAITVGGACVIAARSLIDGHLHHAHAGRAVLLWLLGIALVTAGCWPWAARDLRREHGAFEPLPPEPVGDGTRGRRESRWRGREASVAAGAGPAGAGSPIPSRAPRWLAPAGAVTLTAVAAALRLVDLEAIPWVMSGDEGSVGQEALRWRDGEVNNPFLMRWSGHPTFHFILQSWSIRLSGATLHALRVTSALAGTLTIPLLFVFARRFWGTAVAFAAATVLSGLAVHLHYSRIGIDQAFDPLLMLIVVGAVLAALSADDARRARRWFLIGGLGFGTALYFWGVRLLAVQMLVTAAFTLVRYRRRLWELLRHWLAFAAVGLAVDLPLFVEFHRRPDDFFGRLNQTGIFQAGHVAAAAEPMRFLWDQLKKSLLAWVGGPDASIFYANGATVLRPAMVVLFVVGLLYAARHPFRPPELSLLILLLGTTIFGNALIEAPPRSHHMVIALPAVAIVVALGLVVPGRWMRRRAGGPSALWAGALAAVSIGLAADDAHWYFRVWSPEREFGGLNTEVAHVLGHKLRERGDDVKLYLVTSGRLFADFPSIPYLSRAQSFSVVAPLQVPLDFVTPAPPPVFVVLPEIARELEHVERACPGGTREEVRGNGGRVLFYWYEPAGGCG
jgi:4-amino-4-deoxy-L-arabinose transferase-like glycosyltransferase